MRGERCQSPILRSHWKIATFVAEIRHAGLSTPMVLDGAMYGTAWLANVEQVFVPTPEPGDVVVIMDNLPAHKPIAISEVLEKEGTGRRYLPPSGPDFNPIEMAVSKLNALLKAKACRTIKEHRISIGDATEEFRPKECPNYFNEAGDVPE